MPVRRLRLTIAHKDVPGRLRLRCAELPGDRKAATHVREALTRLPGVKRVDVRANTGSILVEFPKSRPWPDVARRIAEAIANPPPAPAAPSRDPDAGRTKSAKPRRSPASRPRDPSEPWHAFDEATVIERLATDSEQGLTTPEAQARLSRHGPNLLPAEEPRSKLSMLLEQFESLPVAILAGSSVVSVATGGITDAISTMAVVVANAVLGYVTEGQAESAIRSLLDNSAQELTVIRDGRQQPVRVADLVPGDLCLVRAGEQIGADARLLKANRLSVDEAALTGETVPVEKSATACVPRNSPIGARPNVLHSGTIVAEGTGRAVVVATGRRTEAAQIALLSQTADRPQAPVEAELDQVGRGLVKLSLAACGVFFGIGWLRGYALAEILKDSLALAVAAVPEGLPMVATSTMALGLRRMERKDIMIRHIQAIESLGALQTICLDKTGTLTQNRMRAVTAVCGTRMVELDDREALGPLLRPAVLNNDALVSDGAASGSSATERALVDLALANGVDVEAVRAARQLKDTIERRRTRPWMATIHGGRGAKTMVKGAPAAVLARCTRMKEGGRTRPLTDKDRERILSLNETVAERPARVLGFAEGRSAPRDEDPQGLTWLGLVGMVDPLRPGAKTFVTAVQRAGIHPVIVTGDQAATASAIARDLGLGRDGTIRVIDSSELTSLDPALLADLARRTDVFARVSARQKLLIVQALQASGRVVGMTGDGVNDGPALKAADVGIAMGESATNLARDVANVVIGNDELDTLVEAIAEGRTVYRNIRRALEFLVATNLSEILLEIMEAIHGAGELETPMELLWINIATDILPGLGLALADPDDDALRTPPRDPSQPIMPAEDVRRIALDGTTIAVFALAAHLVGLARYGPGPRTRGMTFLSLSMGQLIYTLFSQRRDLRELRLDRLFANRALDGAVLASMLIAGLPFVFPPLRKLLGVAPLSLGDTLVSLAAAAGPAATLVVRRDVEGALEELEAEPCETL